METHPRTGASVLVLRNNKVLLIIRGKEPYKGHWSLPGGSQEIGETLEECAKRELKEETGLEADSMAFAAVRDRIKKDDSGNVSHHFVLATYLTCDAKGEPVALDDADGVGWFTLEDMAKLETTPGTPEFISEILSAVS